MKTKKSRGSGDIFFDVPVLYNYGYSIPVFIIARIIINHSFDCGCGNVKHLQKMSFSDNFFYVCGNKCMASIQIQIVGKKKFESFRIRRENLRLQQPV